tara:strand:+ start:804 stop:1055 length:252 start_codon:yes stop_codon:yes gene_type:complete
MYCSYFAGLDNPYNLRNTTYSMKNIIHLNFGTGEIYEFQETHKAMEVAKQFIASGFDCEIVTCSNADEWMFLHNYVEGLVNSY